MTERKPPPPRTIRGYRVAEFCQREGVSRTTVWRWAKKGALKVSRLAPATGVRVQYVDRDDDDEGI
jgi:predicted site-specific integrase-resolvase